MTIVEHDMNGSKITKGIGEYVKGILAKAEVKPDHLVMAKSQWEKICRLYDEEGIKDADREFVTLPVTLTKHIAESEIHFVDKKDEVIAKIVGLER